MGKFWVHSLQNQEDSTTLLARSRLARIRARKPFETFNLRPYRRYSILCNQKKNCIGVY